MPLIKKRKNFNINDSPCFDCDFIEWNEQYEFHVTIAIKIHCRILLWFISILRQPLILIFHHNKPMDEVFDWQNNLLKIQLYISGWNLSYIFFLFRPQNPSEECWHAMCLRFFFIKFIECKVDFTHIPFQKTEKLFFFSAQSGKLSALKVWISSEKV